MHLGHGEAPEEVDGGDMNVDLELEDWDVMEYEDLRLDPGSPQKALATFARASKASPYDPMLLSHYEAVICSSSTLLDDERNNPYRHVLLPMALDSPGVYHATLAISANVLRLGQPEYAVVALDHRQKALRRLITLLENGGADTSREMDEMLGLVLMLCWFEISDGCSPSWVKHLKGFRSLINRHRTICSQGSQHSLNLEQFFMRYFAFHLVLAKTTFRPEEPDSEGATLQTGTPSSSISDDQTSVRHPSEDPASGRQAKSFSSSSLSSHMHEDTMDEIDPYMGFSNRLLLLINEITGLVRVGNTADNNTLFTNQARHLKSSLDNLHQHLPAFPAVAASASLSASPCSPTTQRDFASRTRAMAATAETYRHGALVLLHHILSQPHPAASISSHVVIHVKELQAAIRSILHTISTHLDDMVHTAALPLWPLFLAGCCVDDEDQRMTALRVFETTEQRKRFGNVTPARQVMEMVWRQRDLGRDQRRSAASAAARRNSDPKVLGMYEWERASLLLGGWKISLT
ncbi:uncharacterized protein A1O9_10824 [Exophiala aquamarina CBS 119918]|uniref:Uncharacterized protein n=1 Tax=Exophiala aquamarina CBS 119918 TaxID=1182545 RepID=A0A072P0W7_9EURO|nr:uncharacterized protein A1O9_10824 [Exophiala aquamarina CBS 119918]KEF52918.1 hypothetical protein A1O9_10824 [Exophiala aquamarina CBS 119918]